MSEPRVEYAGRDLEAMDLAENYREWIWETMRPFVGQDIVEVGAGTGGFSRLLLRSNPRSLSLVEPSEMFGSLEREMASVETPTELRLYQTTFSAALDAVTAERRPDTIIYVNVLEHVEDDERELKLIFEALVPGGHVCVFVPAMPLLYSRYDRRLGHFRRYRLAELTAKCESAGFKISLARRMDIPGVLPWLIKYRVLRSMSMEPWAVRLYDRAVVPIAKRIENVLPPPVGKNILVIAGKE